MKRASILLLLLAWAGCASAAPHVAFFDVPEAIVLGDPGRSSVALAVTTDGWSTSITRSLSSRLDVTVTTNAQTLFAPSARLLVVRDLLPLNVMTEIGVERITLASTLFLGPVHVGFGRRWGTSASRWGIVQHAFCQTATLLLGLDERFGSLGPILGLRLHPGSTRLWGLSAIVTRDGLRLTLGGTL